MVRRLGATLVAGTLVAAALVLAGVPAGAGACTAVWPGGSGPVDDDDSWPGPVPDGDDVVCFPAGDYTLTRGPGGFLGWAGMQLGTDAGGAQPTLVITSGLSVGVTTSYGTIEVRGDGDGATFTVDGVPDDVFDNHGTFRLAEGTGGLVQLAGSDVNNHGLVEVTSDEAEVGGVSPRVFTNHGALSVAAGADLHFDSTNGGTDLDLADGSTVDVDGRLLHSSNRITFGDTTVAGLLENASGTLEFVGSGTTAEVETTATTDLEGTIAPGVTLTSTAGSFANLRVQTATEEVVNQGTVRLTVADAGMDSDLIVQDGATFRNQGTFTVLPGAGGAHQVQENGTFRNEGTVSVEADELVLTQGDLVNAGDLGVAGGSLVRGSSGNGGYQMTFEDGTVDVADTAVLRNALAITQTGGTTTVDGELEAASLALQGGTVEGAGLVDADTTNSGATLAPGASPGRLDVEGTYVQEAGGTLAAEVDGPVAGTDFDQVAVSGAATLAGTLDVTPDQLPAQADVLTAASVAGAFETVEGIPAGWVQHQADRVRIAPEVEFTDVPLTHPFFAEIGWLADSGVTTGFGDGGFHPAGNVTRQAMAAFLYRMAGEPPFEAPATPTFDDVALDHAFFTEIEWLASTGITTGFGDGGFHPAARVTRQAMAAFLYRFVGEPAFEAPATPTFDDVALDHAFFTEIEWLASTGITTGFPDGGFHPAGTITRQAMAAFLYRLADQGLGFVP